ncbi:MAG: glutathione S-transferase C-terminal domain-containing protein [Magnetospirillum sp.]|nr:glutathione S-transferase C-terminal domain-containing protein [Magnetospirillum sp.]
MPISITRTRSPRRRGAPAVSAKIRIPAFLGWFERLLTCNPAGSAHLAGAGLTYADLSLFQVVEGLQYAFPHSTARALHCTPRVAALHEGVGKRPRIGAYLHSPRRVPFNENGIFRRYPELDEE